MGCSQPLNIEVCDPLAHEAYAARATAVEANHAALDAYDAGLRDGRSDGMTAAALLLAVWRAQPTPSVVRTGPLVVDLEAHGVTVDQRAVALSRIEWSILECLAWHVGTLVDARVLIDHVWPGGRVRRPRHDSLSAADPRHLLRTRMSYLRTKLGTAGTLIETRIGEGYVLRDEPPPAEADDENTNKDVS